MKEDLQKYLDYHKMNGGTGKLFNFEIIEHRTGFLKLKGIFNAGFENLSIKKIANMIKRQINCKLKISKSNDPRSYRIDSSKLLSTGFRPKKNVTVAIKEMIKFFKKKKYILTKENINLQKMKNLVIK